MYSYEERLQAVELSLRLGKRCKATLRQLGYGTTNSLKAWCDEFERRGDLQSGYVRSKPRFSDEQKNVAVAHWENNERCFAFTLKAWGLSRSTYTITSTHRMDPRAVS